MSTNKNVDENVDADDDTADASTVTEHRYRPTTIVGMKLSSKKIQSTLSRGTVSSRFVSAYSTTTSNQNAQNASSGIDSTLKSNQLNHGQSEFTSNASKSSKLQQSSAFKPTSATRNESYTGKSLDQQSARDANQWSGIESSFSFRQTIIANNLNDNMLMAVCSAAYLALMICVSFGLDVFVFFHVIHHSNCSIAAPSLLKQARLFVWVYFVAAYFHFIYLFDVFRDCCIIWNIHKSERNISKHIQSSLASTLPFSMDNRLNH
jgi:hypothetical protein